MRTICVSDLVECHELYPRQQVDEANVQSLSAALEAGVALPSIIVEQGTNRIVDGFHRKRSYIRVFGPDHQVSVIEKTYRSDKEFFLDAMKYNSTHGVNLDAGDRRRCLEIAERLSISEDSVAGALSVLTSRLGELRPTRRVEPETVLKVAPPTFVRTNNRNALTRPDRQSPLTGSVIGQRVAAMQRQEANEDFECVNQVIRLLEQNRVDPSNTALVNRLTYLRRLLRELFQSEVAEDSTGPPKFPEALAAIDWEHRMGLLDWYLNTRLKNSYRLSDEEKDEVKQTVCLRVVWFVGHKGVEESSTIWTRLCQWAVYEKCERRKKRSNTLSETGLGGCSVFARSAYVTNSDGEESLLLPGETHDGFDSTDNAEEARQALEKVLKHIHQYDRELLLMYHGQGMTHEEIAAKCGVSRARVHQRITKAEAKLRLAGNRPESWQ